MLFWIAAAFAAFYIKGLCGFANTLVFDGIMAFGADNIAITPTELVLGLPSNVLMAYTHRKGIELKKCLVLAGLIVAGGVPGALILKNTDASIIKVICGLVIALLGVEMLIRELKGAGKIKENKFLTVFFLLTAGVMCGVYGIGALMGAYLVRTSSDVRNFKGNISLVFVIENTVRIIYFSLLGIITVESLKRAVCLMPVMLIATLLGIWSAKLIDEKLAKRVVIVVLIISGIVLLVSSL